MKRLITIVLIVLSMMELIESKKKRTGTLQYDFGQDNGKNILILKTDNLFLPKSSKRSKHKNSLDIQVKKSILMTKNQADKKLRKEIKRRKKIERLLKKEKAKWKKKMKKKNNRKLMFGGGAEKEQEKTLKESMAMFKMLEKSSFRDSMDLLFKVRLQFKAMPGKINTIAKNYEEQLGYKEEAVAKALEQIDVKIKG